MSTTLRAVVALLVVIAAASVRAGPLLFHDHGHGLAFSSDGKALLAPSRAGLAAYRDGAWSDAPAATGQGSIAGFSGFSVTQSAIYASGHSQGNASGSPAGLLRTQDGGKTWRALALAGETNFHLLAAGYHASAIYVLNIRPNSAMPSAGLYMTRDQGKTWRHAALRGLKGEIHGLSAHPRETGTVAVATGSGLYLSRDEGQNFVALDAREPVTAVAFDLHGDRLRYARTLSYEIIDLSLANRERRVLARPRLKGDYVTCLAQNPVDEGMFAFATRRREVFVTRNAGKSWHRITPGEDGSKD